MSLSRRGLNVSIPHCNCIPPMPNLHLLMMPCYVFAVMCQLSVFELAGGGWHDWRVLWGVVWCGQLVCDCVWAVEMGDRHTGVWVLLDGACCMGWRMRLLLLLRPSVLPMLSYHLDYG